MSITVKVTKVVEAPVKYLRARCGVRYWEDGEVNGVEDVDGNLIPCRLGDSWCPVIDLETGVIQGWPEGVAAKTHYKVCDDGEYALLDADKNVVLAIADYVPAIMSPGDGGGGGGDYVVMSIGPDGKVENWRCDFDEFVKAA